jgi:hypothetical protein
VIGGDPTLEVDGEEHAARGCWLATNGGPFAPRRGAVALFSEYVISLLAHPFGIDYIRKGDGVRPELARAPPTQSAAT